MRLQVFLSAFAATLYMANASDSLGHSNCSASAPIELFTLADANAMAHAHDPTKTAGTDKIDQAGTKENSKGNPAAAAKAEKVEQNLVKGVQADLTKSAQQIKKDALGKASGELKKVMEQIPYLREVIVGGEMAKLAFEYLKANAPEHVKEDARGAWNVAIQGRFKAFKNWVTSAWTGESRLSIAIGDYEDFLAMFPKNDET